MQFESVNEGKVNKAEIEERGPFLDVLYRQTNAATSPISPGQSIFYSQ